MPLTNVWMRDPHRHDEWIRTSIEQVDKSFDSTIPASSHMLRCNICCQYIIFVKGTVYVSSYFKHNRAEQDKECEDRSFGSGGYVGPGSIDDLPGLLRLRIGNTRPHLEIGLYPINEEQLQKAIVGNASIKIIGLTGQASIYRVDRSRFSPHITTWLPLHLSWAEKYEVAFSPAAVIPARWKNERITVSKNGSIFDGITMRILSRGSDIAVGRKYYLLCGKRVVIGFRGSIQSRKMDTGSEDWSLYEICAPAYSTTAADFFFDRFQLRLTAYPAEIQPIWPPVIEKDDILETKQKELYLYLKGESEFACYPLFADFKEKKTRISDETKLIHLGNVASLQMISSYRNSQKLNAVYVCPWDHLPVATKPSFCITDDNGDVINDGIIERIPPRGILRVISEVDASVVVEDQNGFLYRKAIPAQEEIRLIDLKEGMRAVFRQGLTIVSRIQIGIQRSIERKTIIESLRPWAAELVPFPSRYAWLLGKMVPGSELFSRTAEALNKGQIPKDGLKYIIDWRRGIQA